MDLERKKLWLLTTLSLQCWESCLFRRHSTILSFIDVIFSLTYFIFFYQFWALRSECFLLLPRNFRRCCQIYKLSVETNIWWKLGFPLKKCESFQIIFSPWRKKCAWHLLEQFGTAVKTGESSWKQNKFLWTISFSHHFVI